MDQVIDAAGITSLLASAVFVIFSTVRFVRTRVARRRRGASDVVDDISPPGGWNNRNMLDGSGHARTPEPPSKSPRSSEARNLVLSDSEEIED